MWSRAGLAGSTALSPDAKTIRAPKIAPQRVARGPAHLIQGRALVCPLVLAVALSPRAALPLASLRSRD